MNAERTTSRSAWWIAGLLVAYGAAVSGHLLARTFALLAPGGHPGPDVCSTLFAASCDGSLSDERSWVLGIPLAGWGLVYFAAIGAVLALARFVEGDFEALAAIAASVLAIAGTGAGLALVLGAWFDGAAICPLCLSIHATSLALVFVLQRAVGRPLRAKLSLAREAWTGLVRTPSLESARWTLVGLGSAALVAGMTYQWVFVESALRRPPPPDRTAAISDYFAMPQRILPVSPSDPHRGPMAAPVQLVVFESLQCPHCQRFAPVLVRLEREFHDRLLVVFKHYPLSSRCNDRVGSDMQPDACQIAWAAEAAHLQSRFWQFHDAMLAAGPRASAGVIAQAAHGAGLDSARFESDRRSDSVRERVAEDVELGNRLQIPGTPATYLDGRYVRHASAEVLEILIRNELKRRSTRLVPIGGTAKTAAGPGHGRRPGKGG